MGFDAFTFMARHHCFDSVIGLVPIGKMVMLLILISDLETFLFWHSYLRRLLSLSWHLEMF